MRRFDKKENIRKANILAEQRHLQSKGLIIENEDWDLESRKQEYGINPEIDQEELNSENTYKVEVIGKEAEKDGGYKHSWVYEITANNEEEAEAKAADKFNENFRLSDIYLFSVKTITNPTEDDKFQPRGTRMGEMGIDEDNVESQFSKPSFADSIVKGAQSSLHEDDNENTEFKVGDSIENAGNDGAFFDMNSDSEQFVEFPSELSGEIVDIKDGFYILKGEYKGKPFGMVKVKISDPYYRKKRMIDNEGNVYVETYDELKRELRRNYDVNNISYTGVEGDSMYFWLEPSETMVGEFNKDENIAWFKPSN
jgi:hypothetical protein